MKKKKRKGVKRTPIDMLLTEYIKLKANGECEWCGKVGKTQGMHISHFIGRTYIRTRYDEDNVAYLCFGCHKFMHDFPSIHTQFFEKRLGSDGVEKLEIKARAGGEVDKDKIKASFKEKIKLEGLQEKDATGNEV